MYDVHTDSVLNKDTNVRGFEFWLWGGIGNKDPDGGQGGKAKHKHEKVPTGTHSHTD